MKVLKIPAAGAAARRLAPRRWLLCIAALLLLVTASASPALASHGGGSSHGGGGGSHGGGGGNHGGGGGNHGGGGGGNHGGSGGGNHGGGYHGGGTHHGGGGSGGFYDGYHSSFPISHGFHHGFNGGFHGSFRYFYPAFWGSIYFGFPYPYWWYGPWGYYGYYGYDGYYPGGYYRYHDRAEQGALDLDLSPGDTQVYLDGKYVGTVNDFDGWPQYLWLDPGTYDIVFYREGYKTLARQVTIYRGLVIDWDDRLERGPSIRPEDLPATSHERRDARIEQDREMRERAEQGRPPYDDDWRDRERADRDRYERDRDRYDRERERSERREAAPPHSEDAGRVHLAITPHDASIYLDGRFLGTADDVARRRSGVSVDPGQHTLSVVRPGHRAEERQFEVKAGEEIDLKIDLRNE
jgi:PEGA domain-containing protein